MREILFRGLTFGGAWVYGNYQCIKYGTKEYHRVGNREVRPETVGQFTGTYDSKDNRIFEHDIVLTTNDAGEQFYDEVMWEKHECGFRIAEVHGFDGSIVVGNIHENKDLV